ncbi:hypothetical protein EV13_2363 [Prochlorococcus sp. MIT 0702]|nr:hypothetical protein EV12_1917 [Prochlorococcus sp. MIT 0701]KGG26902.1 hypothetical protein EV13_2363 [Prochlorococcus sp. MIT 0702]KGG36178.1 hypothetical protein EV14_0587 [Prochlorococcus sp. MIT 0703]
MDLIGRSLCCKMSCLSGGVLSGYLFDLVADHQNTVLAFR